MEAMTYIHELSPVLLLHSKKTTHSINIGNN